jgi:hypothetical protein
VTDGAGLDGREDPLGWRAVELLYHAYLAGLILFVVSRRGAGDAAALVFATFRRQHLAKFLPGLEKLGLRGLPDAVACARYHYLSNFLGGVPVEYVEESDRKAWIRYPPPRWIWQGPAICGIPSEVSRAVLRGWHAHNGVTLGNPRLGFVCTKQTVDGQPGLEGYYLEHDRDLAPEERLRFAPDESPPAGGTSGLQLPQADWPPARLHKARRNYAMDYVATILPEAVRLFGPLEGGHLAGGAARLIGMQYYRDTAALLAGDAEPPEGGGPQAFAEHLVRMGRAQGDDTTWARDGGQIVVRQSTWRLMAEAGPLSPAVFEAWTELWRGAALAHDPRLDVDVGARGDPGDSRFEWRLRPR